MSVRDLSRRYLRSTARRLALEPPGWLYSLSGTDRQPVVQRELAVTDPEDLLGLTADAHWCGLAVVLPAHTTVEAASGTAQPPFHGDSTICYAIDRQSHSHLAVHRRGTLSSMATGAKVSGFVADATARILGLATEATDIVSTELIVRVWLQNLLDASADPTTSSTLATWSDAVGFHPAWRVGGGRLQALDHHDPDDVAEVTIALGRKLGWERMRQLAAGGTIHVPGLASSTAAWMDAPFFARWTLDVHRPPDELLDDLSLFLKSRLLARLRYTVDAVGWLGFADSHAS